MPKAASPSADPQDENHAADDQPSVTSFDYGGEAELFPTRMRKGHRQALAYRRFARAADAIQYAIEKLPHGTLAGTYLEVQEQRFAGDAIRELYDSEAYPLVRANRVQ